MDCRNWFIEAYSVGPNWKKMSAATSHKIAWRGLTTRSRTIDDSRYVQPSIARATTKIPWMVDFEMLLVAVMSGWNKLLAIQSVSIPILTPSENSAFSMLQMATANSLRRS